MKKTLLVMALILSSFIVCAQKKTITLGKVHTSSGVSSYWADQLRQEMMTGLAQSSRFNFYDRSTLDLYGDNKDRLAQLKEEYNIDYIITATITSLAYEFSRTKDGKPRYSAKMKYTVSVTATENGEAVHVFTHEHFGSSSKNSDDAYKDCFDLIGADMKTLIEESFPLVGTIQIIEESHPKKGAKSVYIDLGSAMGVDAGTYMDVFKIREIAGREVQTNIGTLRCKEVVAEDLSLCTVKKGGKEIQTAIENGEVLIVKTRPAGLLEL